MLWDRCSKLRATAGGLALTLLLPVGLSAEPLGHLSDLSDADNAIRGLRNISKGLSEAVKRFHTHLDETVARNDQ
jgi:hypothetical protein